ncbi:hypothetical protein [Tychonema sp. LEGE 07203]|uniref:hypothetical protein n=1 Tax=Tychonema sp. LEGE 07203 TaxID=1828671 RepID=UPI001881CA55|nr:hypothetical protein [Tychonema sp. LEGE 07203]MBE9097415.1 hypothetical protein [Tychonema sp. LEGE 07203]
MQTFVMFFNSLFSVVQASQDDRTNNTKKAFTEPEMLSLWGIHKRLPAFLT